MTRLADAAWPEIAALAAAGAVLVVPVGATEQHGPHLPVTTDSDIATAVVEAAAAADPLLVAAPVVAFGSSGEHDGFAGTLSIGQDATESLLVELGRSATAQFAHVVFACTHGGNSVPLQRALAQLAKESRPVTGWWPRWGGDLHAGRTETSIMLAIDPDRVRLAEALAGNTSPLAELLPLMQSGGVRSVSPNGVLGDPTGANADEGQVLIQAAAVNLAGLVATLRPGKGAASHTASSSGTDSGRIATNAGIRTASEATA